MEELKEVRKENRLGFIVLIVSLLICIISISYAIWTNVYSGKKENVLKTGTLVLNLNEKSKNIELLNSIPISNDKSTQQEPYTFSLQNSGSVEANYRISLIDDTDYYISDNCVDNKLDWSFINYSFNENQTTPIIKGLAETSGILKEGKIGPGEELNYTLKLWLNINTTANEMGKHFHSKIKVEAIQSDQDITN